MFKHKIPPAAKVIWTSKLLISIIILLLTFGFIISRLEPERFPTIFDGIWWAVITTSTVGYGDFVPETIPGRMIGITLIFLGVGFLSAYFAKIAARTIALEEKIMKGSLEFKGENHFIIVGWNERSRNIIGRLQSENYNQPIVLIDATVRKHPDPSSHFHFIHGKAIEDHILHKANIQKASKIMITADVKQHEYQTDMYSILTLIASKGLNPSIYSCVEILTSSQVPNANRAGADHVIETNLFAGETMVSILTQESPSST